MDKDSTQEEIASGLAQKMAENASEHELRRLYEETMFQQFMTMNKKELQSMLWHG